MKFILLFLLILVFAPAVALADYPHKSTDRQAARPTPQNIVETSTGPYIYARALTVEATAYSHLQPQLSNYTATGIPARHGVIAVDPRYIPLGTRLYIPGYGHALAADTGGAIRGYKIDLAFNSIAEVWQFGRQHIRVYILE